MRRLQRDHAIKSAPVTVLSHPSTLIQMNGNNSSDHAKNNRGQLE